MTRNVLGVIPARGGSKGIPRKNLLTLGGKTLLELAIESAQESRLLTRTIVSTEDAELASVARASGAQVPFTRPSDLASDTASTWSVMQHAVTWLSEFEGWYTDVLVVLQPTTPFRRGKHIDEAVRVLFETRAESVMTIRRVDYPPHWMLQRGDDGVLSRLIDNGKTYTRRQDTPRAYQPNGLAYVIRYDKLMTNPCLPGRDTRGVLMTYEDSINIDEWWQYRLAQVIWDERSQGEL